MPKYFLAVVAIFTATQASAVDNRPELRVGRAGHAYDHVGAIAAQAEAAAASGATIIYATGIGGLAYAGLPPADELTRELKSVSEYNRAAKSQGIELSLGYLCATSIVKLETFDKNWPDDFRARFKTPPAAWRQQDRQGQPLASWYGGDYQPACMNNPDWREYERAMVRYNMESGHDGVFFDNPTVHPQGCYCPHCMEKFVAFLEQEGHAASPPTLEGDERIAALRQLTDAHPNEFRRFRAMIASDFLADMRGHARSINPRALMTCNNSLNAPSVLFSQCRNYGYNIQAFSKVEDLIVVEDMGTQPRTEANGQIVEYGSTYKLLQAIGHGKPIVAVTLVGDDYHTAPNLMKLAMAEAAAHGASYLSWPTWPVEQRARMIAAVRPQADLLRRNEDLLNNAEFRSEVVLFLPYRRWVETDQCTAGSLAASLTQANVQYSVVSEEDFDFPLAGPQRPVLLIESMAVLTPTEQTSAEIFEKEGGRIVTGDQSDWFLKVRAAVGPSAITIEGAPSVRGIVRDQPGRTIVHLYNLNVERINSFADKVTPAETVKVTVTVPFAKVRSVKLDSADAGVPIGALEFTTQEKQDGARVQFVVSRIPVSSILVIERDTR